MEKLKLFIENFLVYGFGGIINKLIPLIMVPVVTRLMPSTEYYGLSDLSNTIVQFGSALAIMGMYDAMYRMFFEKEEEEYKKNVCSTALLFTICTSAFVFLMALFLKNIIAQYFLSDRKYAYIVYISAMAVLVGATNSIISAPTRMQNKRKVYLISNIVSSLLSYSIAIPLLIAGYYTIALPLATVTSGVIIEVSFSVLNYKWFSIKRFNREILKELLVIAIPLLPNFLIYWIFNSCDKIMITNIIGIGAAGIYSVSSKLGHCSQLIYTAFAGGWQFFALSTMKDDNQVKSNSTIFECLALLSFIATAFICAWSFSVFRLLFPSNYWEGYIAAPYLFFAPLLQMLFQVAASQFLVIKKTWPNMFILSTGAIANILINYTLIPILGIEGASIATLLGYVISDTICVLILCKMKLMIIMRRFLASTVVMAIYFILWRFYFYSNSIIGTICAVILVFVFTIIYQNEIRLFIKKLKRGMDNG